MLYLLPKAAFSILPRMLSDTHLGNFMFYVKYLDDLRQKIILKIYLNLSKFVQYSVLE